MRRFGSRRSVSASGGGSKPPLAPVLVSVFPPPPFTTQTQLQVVWLNPKPYPTTFYIERSLTGTGGWVLVATISGAGGADNIVDFGLTPGTTYYYRVRSRNAGGFSPYSNIVSAIAQYAYLPGWSYYGNDIGCYITNSPVLLTDTTDVTLTTPNAKITDSSEGWASPNQANHYGINASSGDLVIGPDFSTTSSVFIQCNAFFLGGGSVYANAPAITGAANQGGNGGSGGGQGGDAPKGNGYNGGTGIPGDGAGQQGLGFGYSDVSTAPDVTTVALGGNGYNGANNDASGGGPGFGFNGWGGGGGGAGGSGGADPGGGGGGGGGLIYIVARFFSGSAFGSLTSNGAAGGPTPGFSPGGGGGGGAITLILKQYDGSLTLGVNAFVSGFSPAADGTINLFELSADETTLIPHSLSDTWDNNDY